MPLRLVEEDGSVEWVQYDGDEPPASILVQRPFFAILGTRYRLEWPELRSYRFVHHETLPPRNERRTA